ncbi:MAG: calcium-binding protein, partial [Gammaproteobacteria bacterium]
APKYLNPHFLGTVVRMIYDPDRDGVPNRFNLVGLEVKSGALKVHAEIDYSGVNGAVYGPIGEGSVGLGGPGNTDLLFVDLDWCTEGCGTSPGGIDNIVFEPAAGTGPTSTCNGIRATIVGTPGDDTFSGTWLPDIIDGGGGNDTIISYSGNDVICGGPGNDTISSGVEFRKNLTKVGVDDDVVSGGPGNDKITSGDGDDKIGGGKGRDTCDGGRHINGDTAKLCETVTNIP